MRERSYAMPVDILLAAIWLGFFAAGATVLIRVLPPIIPLVERGLKPWACDFCMSFWLVLLGCAALPLVAKALGCEVLAPVVWLSGPAAYGLALLVLRRLTDPIGPPPVFGPGSMPELKDPNEERIIVNFSDPPPAH